VLAQAFSSARWAQGLSAANVLTFLQESASRLSSALRNNKTTYLSVRCFVIELTVLAATYFPLASIIGDGELNFRVRNGNGCDPSAKPPKH
jgi:hypothetical protein